jgi:4-amino-4-deoxy-L-arabinose transferase-like glycosyltransferase
MSHEEGVNPNATRHTNVALLLIVLLALSLRIAGATYWHRTAIESESGFRFGDSDTYWFHANRIANGQSYQYLSEESKIFRAPLYPVFLAPFALVASEDPPRAFWSAVLAARYAGALLGTLGVVVVYAFAARLGGRRAGLAASLGAACYPGAIGMSIFILSEAVFCPLMMLSLSCSFLGLEEKRGRFSKGQWTVLAGIATGLACLARPSWGLWAGLWWVYLFTATKSWTSIRTFLLTAGRGLLFGLGIVLAMAPWWIRNYKITGKFVPSTLQVGASLYDGWHAGASGSSDEGMGFVEQYVQEQKKTDAEMLANGLPLESTFEWRLDKRIRNAAIQWAKENPSDACQLGLVKFVKTWRPLPVAKELGSAAIRYAEGLSYSVIVVFGFWGCWVLRQRRGAWLFAMPCVYFGVLHMLFIGSIRYRQPAILVLCVLAGVGVEWILRKVGHGWRTRKQNQTPITT